MVTRGLHLIADFWGCSRTLLEDQTFLERVIKETARETGAHLRKLDSHKFEPDFPPHSCGVTAYAILAESHIAIHTYPEAGFASVDIFTCGNHSDPKRGYEFLKRRLRPTSVSLSEIVRGEFPSQ